MEPQTPRAVAYLLRMTTGERTGVWVLFDAERVLYGEAGETRRALLFRWRHERTGLPVVQRRPGLWSRVDAEQFIAATQRRMATGVVRGVPAAFAECCRAIKERTVHAGYEAAGRELARRLETEAPPGVTADAWQDELQHLRRLIDGADHVAALAWFDAHYPTCMALIPQRRRRALLRGVYHCFQRAGGS
jgi:hypothetical protein